MKKLSLLVALLVFAGSSALAFDGARAREILNTLASDEYEGRRPGSEGGYKAEQMLGWKLSEYKIHPGGMAGYFQSVPMLLTEERGSTLTLMDHELGKISMLSGVDYSVITHSGSNALFASAVIVGYGDVRPDKNRDDYGDTDVNGKAVVILRGTPESPYDFQEDYSRRATLGWAKEKGAAAVLYYQDAQPTYGAAIPEELYDENLPLLYIGDRVLGLLLDGTGYSVETYKARVKEAPLVIDTNKRLWIDTKVAKVTSREARNVLGMIYGTDPVLKNEVIVVGAHHDHIGRNGEGVIYNGADDNASGSAIVTELARSLAERPTKRSILIAYFTGEEAGLLGSDFFVKNPSIPLVNIAGMVNLDCEGQGTGTVVMAGGETWGQPWNEYSDGIDSLARSKILFYRQDGHGGSDHASFLQSGVPALAFWSRGDHPFYHSYEDDSRWISDDVLTAIGSRAENFIRFMADRSGSIASHADTARVLSRMTAHIDFTGVPVDAQGSLPRLSNAVTAAWLNYDGAASFAEAVRRSAEMQHNASLRDVATGTIGEALKAHRNHRKSLVLGMHEADLSPRKPSEVKALIRQGLNILRLAPGTTAGSKAAPSPAIAAALNGGMYAVMPFDFTTPGRIDRWKDHAIVNGQLRDFTNAPESIRNGLLTSDALLVLEVDETPTILQLQSVYAGRARQVHISFGSIPVERRDEHARLVIASMLEGGYTRDEILLLTGGNLRRFFQ